MDAATQILFKDQILSTYRTIALSWGADASQAEAWSQSMVPSEKPFDDDWYRAEAWKRIAKSESLSSHRGTLKTALLESLARKAMRDGPSLEVAAFYGQLSEAMMVEGGLTLEGLEECGRSIGYRQRAHPSGISAPHVYGFPREMESAIFDALHLSPLAVPIFERWKAVSKAVDAEGHPVFAVDRLQEMLVTLYEGDLSRLSCLEVFKDFDFAAARAYGFIRDEGLRGRIDQAMRAIADADAGQVEGWRASFEKSLDALVSRYLSGESLTNDALVSCLWPEGEPIHSPLMGELIGWVRSRTEKGKIRLEGEREFLNSIKPYKSLSSRCTGFYAVDKEEVVIRNLPVLSPDDTRPDFDGAKEMILSRLRALVEELEHARHFPLGKFDLRYRRHRLITEGMAKATLGVWTYFFQGDFEFRIAAMQGKTIGEYWVGD